MEIYKNINLIYFEEFLVDLCFKKHQTHHFAEFNQYPIILAI